MQFTDSEKTCVEKHIGLFRNLLGKATLDFYDKRLKPGHALVTPFVRDGKFGDVTLDQITAQPLDFFQVWPNLHSSAKFRAALDECDGKRKSVLVVLITKGSYVFQAFRRVDVLRKTEGRSLLSWITSPETKSMASLEAVCGPKMVETLRGSNSDDMVHILHAAQRTPPTVEMLVGGFLPMDLELPEGSQAKYDSIRKTCFEAVEQRSQTPEIAVMEPIAAGREAMKLVLSFQNKVFDQIFGGDPERFFGALEVTSGFKAFQKTLKTSFQHHQKLCTVAQEIRNRKCAQCGTQERKLQRCGKCKQVLYCGTACQRMGWLAGHKKTCGK